MDRIESYNPRASRENLKRINPFLIKQEAYRVNHHPEEWQWQRYQLLNQTLQTPVDLEEFDPIKSLERKMNDNINLTGKSPDAPFGNKYIRSAFFSIVPPPRSCVLVEFTKVLQDGRSQIPYNHNMLREYIDTQGRYERNKWQLRSGHYGQIKIPGTHSYIWVALIDSIEGGRILTPEDSTDYTIAMTLLSHDIIPITADGFVVSFEKT